MERLYKDLERRIVASPPGLCPVDMAASFLKMCHAQTCGKCVPCRVGLGQLGKLLDQVLEGEATMETIDLIEKTARVIADTADCAIGFSAANMVLKGVTGFRDDYEEHVPLREMSRFSGAARTLRGSLSRRRGYSRLHCPGGGRPVSGRGAPDPQGQSPSPPPAPLVCEHPCEARCRRNMIDTSVQYPGHEAGRRGQCRTCAGSPKGRAYRQAGGYYRRRPQRPERSLLPAADGPPDHRL